MDFTGTGGGTLDNAKEKITIAVRTNGDFKKKDSPIPPFTIEHEWSLPFLLQQASKHLEMYPEADSVHNEHGDEILNCLLIEENDTLYLLKKGEKFKTPPDALTNAHLPTKIGKYQVGIHLGTDPMGLHVALGTEIGSSERVVLKFLAKRKLRSVQQNDLIQNEITCLQKLSHPNIMKLLSRDETRDHVVLEFELLEGGNLRQYLVSRGAPMSETTAKIVLRSLVSAVSCMHFNRIIHKVPPPSLSPAPHSHTHTCIHTLSQCYSCYSHHTFYHIIPHPPSSSSSSSSNEIPFFSPGFEIRQCDDQNKRGFFYGASVWLSLVRTDP